MRKHACLRVALAVAVERQPRHAFVVCVRGVSEPVPVLEARVRLLAGNTGTHKKKVRRKAERGRRVNTSRHISKTVTIHPQAMCVCTYASHMAYASQMCVCVGRTV